MRIKLYQNPGRTEQQILCLFISLDEIQKQLKTKRIPSELYECVWQGELDARSTEDVFRIFNLEHPDGYQARSMSVSDIVEVLDPDGESSACFYCDPIGFRQVEFRQDSVSPLEPDNKPAFSDRLYRLYMESAYLLSHFAPEGDCAREELEVRNDLANLINSMEIAGMDEHQEMDPYNTDPDDLEAGKEA